ncbi:uncharacterized protein BXZ73DRAFT_80238 [Epithele typhae]|uniref:uncharacterized protein n=1 Tax=Epithele typhae TaxID=378194 RepID=UPI0020078D77|nr:uncharacterized protein BXZ73DRAFT_80238 [Epithele typhae]KAH9920003.1 hypothetical protein BXZ73DRAFT_80238 [Epithele typhae]
MAVQFAPITPSKLRDELLTHPLMLSVGSLSLSTFMSRSIYGMIDWRPVLICVASDILAIGMDHYFDQAPMLSYALKTGNSEMTSIFRQAKMLLYSNALLLLLALAVSPPWTWAMVAIFFGPAFVWDFKLFVFGGQKKPKKSVSEEAQKPKPKSSDKPAFTIKRIPGMKAVLIGIIRGRAGPNIWNPTQIIVWSTINRAAHAPPARAGHGRRADFHEDWEKQVPTIPVLLKSVFRTKLLLTAVHLFTTFLYSYNPYIVFASLYATVLVWFLDENSPRGFYRLSFHSQTLTAVLYGAVEATKWYTSYQSM